MLTQVDPNAFTSPVARIRELNDALRTSFAGQVTATHGALEGKSLAKKRELFRAVMTFDAFTEDNDPHGEHDCALFDFEGERYLWKIDYYDRALEYGSEDPSDPAQTTRVLTIMRANEY